MLHCLRAHGGEYPQLVPLEYPQLIPQCFPRAGSGLLLAADEHRHRLGARLFVRALSDERRVPEGRSKRIGCGPRGGIAQRRYVRDRAQLRCMTSAG